MRRRVVRFSILCVVVMGLVCMTGYGADPRNTEQSVYTQAHLLWLGILLFMMHLGSSLRLAQTGLTSPHPRTPQIPAVS